ncbi:hypothetical protein DAPPUDRAFT_338582 [Daphnia pulex]|uniref:RyR/IP3R Homology associated domain-containing protein n=1 Tax=Daphnia pulex TaxID=6669 RepID=E9I2Y5_DAPPU|nr:hypothetical protein DAPPUDRAFT_338582 [Daphnia pulex]|eukprot:EFX61648.1 hypothetical protein DAPPUDRAFT_338582 [Daphnia pulex]
MASTGNNKLQDHSHEMKDHFPYDMKVKHQRMMSTRASNGNVTVGERMDPYSDSWNSSRLDDSTTTTLSSVNSTLEDLVRQQQQPKSLTTATDSDMESKLSAKVLVMLPVFRFLQLLCENHNRDLQNFLRAQSNKNSYNLVSETLMFLDCIWGSTTGELGLLGLYINEHNVALINQRQRRMDLVLKLKNNASKLLLAVMESGGDSENAERILYNMNPRQLVDDACKAYHQKFVGGEEAASPKKVGQNIYILCHQLAQHNKKLAALMKPPPVDGVSGDVAVLYYANHTAQIEIVRHDRTMEQIVFPIPEMCEYLTNDTKVRVFHTAERDDQGSKVAAFFEGLAHVHLESNPLQFGIIINLIVAFFYPFDTDGPAPDPGTHLSGLIWAVMLLSAAVAITLPKPSGIRTLVMTVILRLICPAGPQPTLMLLGTAGSVEGRPSAEHHGQRRDIPAERKKNLHGHGYCLPRR